ncbi:hypothetical protein, partial [uncultured Fretibacterium sp.]|uniref:hypothetical protein n=1 Tax=uncultured Fretibacterium sp. TaxID=1678694 RepID=UPI0026026CDB
DRPSRMTPPDPLANADMVSAMLEGIFPTDSYASTNWLSVPDAFNCRMIASSFPSSILGPVLVNLLTC